MSRDDIFRKSQEFEQMFAQARQFTEELLRENERLRNRLQEVQRQQQTASTAAVEEQIRSLQARIRQLEEEKRQLQALRQSPEGEGTDFAARHAEIEEQNNNLANLYVASYQLHSTLNFSEVITTVKEILINLIGADIFSLMLLDERSGELAVVASEHLPGKVGNVRLGDGVIGGSALSGQTHLAPSPIASEPFDPLSPLAAIPLKLKDQVIGVICIYSLMTQKERFQPIDYELFTLLASQAATAIFSSQLYSRSERKLNTIQNFIELLTAG